MVQHGNRAKNKGQLINQKYSINRENGTIHRIGGNNVMNSKIRRRASKKPNWSLFGGWKNKQQNMVTGKYTETPTLQMARLSLVSTGVNEMYAQCNKNSLGTFVDSGGNILCQFFLDHFLEAGIFAFGDTSAMDSDGLPTDKSKNYHMYEFKDQYNSLAALPDYIRVLEMRIKDTVTNNVIRRYLSVNRNAVTNSISGFMYSTYAGAFYDKATSANPAPAYDSGFSLKNGVHAAGQQYEFNIIGLPKLIDDTPKPIYKIF